MSFEVSNLKYLRTKSQVRVVQLVDADGVKADGSMSLVAPYGKPYDLAVARDPRTFARNGVFSAFPDTAVSAR